MTHIRTVTICGSPAHWVKTLAAAIFVTAAVMPVAAQESDTARSTRWNVQGDFRGRFEMDRSSMNADGTERPDRDRFRVRGRLGASYSIDDLVGIGVRLRTGHPDSRQSPHVTLGNDFSTFPIALDRLFASVRADRGSLWFGKNVHPFVRQNELFWDADVTPEGAGGTLHVTEREQVSLDLHGGAFVFEPARSSTISDAGRILALQAVGTSRGQVDGMLAAGVEVIRQNPDASDTGISELDYTILTASTRFERRIGDTPISAGADVAINLESYDASVFHRDEKRAFSANIQAGPGGGLRRLAARYTYAHVEALAVVASFAQDDWLRWGSQTLTRSSNFRGHEFRLRFGISTNQNLVARFYRVEGIQPRSPEAEALESGTRFRLDWNVSF